MTGGSMSGLVEKLEAAEVGSQMLSAFVMQSVRAPEGRVEQSPFNGRWCVYDERGRLVEDSSRNGWWREGGWEVTTSLDAALALAERVLDEDQALCWLSYVVWRAEEDTVSGTIKGLPLDLCIAILRALNLNETRHAE